MDQTDKFKTQIQLIEKLPNFISEDSIRNYSLTTLYPQEDTENALLHINYLLNQLKSEEDSNARVLVKIINGVYNNQVYNAVIKSEKFKIENLKPKSINIIIDKFAEIEEPQYFQIKLLITILENNRLAVSANKLLNFLMTKSKMLNSLKNKNENALLRLIKLVSTVPDVNNSLKHLSQLHQLAYGLSQQNYQNSQLA